MRVNSAFTSFFTHRLVMLAIFFIASSFTKRPDRDLRAKQANLIIRDIGHRLLLQAGDSTSLVLPVTEAEEGTFLLQLENQFFFNHDSLMALSQSLLPKTLFPSGYTVTVHDCMKAFIVYGFQINNTTPDILPCRGRSQPAGCYLIEFAFPDLYENAEQKKADIGPLTEEPKSSKVVPQKANPIPIPIASGTIGTAELKSFKVDTKEANRIPPDSYRDGTEESETTTFDYPFISLVCSGMMVLLSVALLIGRFRKSLVPVPVPVQNQDHAIIKESVPEVPALGKFLFDAKGKRLLPIAIGTGSEVISLTDKECRILELLNKNFGELIPRETLMQKVWINEGVITGRSLDMFVSKLRKKLSSDPELRITNVHGKGYKLEVASDQLPVTSCRLQVGQSKF
jgi:DNA-binding winged helix-turn-helix (wHTH) protein